MILDIRRNNPADKIQELGNHLLVYKQRQNPNKVFNIHVYIPYKVIMNKYN